MMFAYKQDESQRSVEEKCGRNLSLSRDSITGLPLPPSCLLPLGHTAGFTCHAERVFSQIAYVNYSPVFKSNFLFLCIFLSHIWIICVFESFCLFVGEFVAHPFSE